MSKWQLRRESDEELERIAAEAFALYRACRRLMRWRKAAPKRAARRARQAPIATLVAELPTAKRPDRYARRAVLLAGYLSGQTTEQLSAAHGVSVLYARSEVRRAWATCQYEFRASFCESMLRELESRMGIAGRLTLRLVRSEGAPVMSCASDRWTVECEAPRQTDLLPLRQVMPQLMALVKAAESA